MDGSSFVLNPQALAKFQLNVSSASRMKKTWSSKDMDLEIRGVAVSSKAEAEKIGKFKSGLIRNLYAENTSPYRGQITNTVGCAKSGFPLIENSVLFGQKQELIFVGANSRRSLGGCLSSEFSKLAGYLNVYDAPSKLLLEILVFMELESKTKGSIKTKAQVIQKRIQELFAK